jgi:hypothetical protein
MDEHILKGNSAILKCHIPSFVSDFVVIDAWIDEESGDEFRYDAGGQLGTEHLFGSNLAFLFGSISFSSVVLDHFMFFLIISTNPNLEILPEFFEFSISLTACLKFPKSFFPRS